MDLSRFGFKPAKERPSYLRFLVFGESFTGKSSFALSAPKPIVFDLEGSTVHIAKYGAVNENTGEAIQWVNTDFYVADVSHPYDIVKTLYEWRNADIYKERPFETIIIDPITILWERIQAAYAEQTGRVDKHVSSEEHLFDRDIYRFDEWAKMKRPIREILTWLNEAPVHKIYTAHSGSKFVEQIVNGRRQIVEAGKVAKAESGVEYHVDVIIEMLRSDDDRNIHGEIGVGLIHKDRTQRFRVGELIKDPRFEMWAGAEVKEPQKTVNRNIAKPVKKYQAIIDNPKVKELAEKLGLTDEQLLAGIKKYKTLDATIEALENRLREVEF